MTDKILIKIYSFVWQYWLREYDTVVKVLGFKTALIDRCGQRIKGSPMIWQTLKNKWHSFKYRNYAR